MCLIITIKLWMRVGVGGVSESWLLHSEPFPVGNSVGWWSCFWPALENSAVEICVQ